MIRTQTVTLAIEFDDEEHNAPASWDWPNVIDSSLAVEVLAFSKAEGLVAPLDD